MICVNTKEGLKNVVTEKITLVCYRKSGCLGCMKVSKLLEFIDDDDHSIIAVDCDGKLDDFEIVGTPYWAVFRNGVRNEGINPAANNDELYKFLTENVGIEIMRAFFNLKIEEGMKYVDQMQDIYAEMIFSKSSNDENSIISAARLKILKACTSKEEIEMISCIDNEVNGLVLKLKNRMDMPDGNTTARQIAIKMIPNLKEECIEYLKKKDI